MNLPSPSELLAGLAQQARAAAVFGEIQAAGNLLTAAALPAEVNAHYYVALTGAQAGEVGLRTPDRWVSESIEADLMHRGDLIEELLEEELAEQGCGITLKVDHFRDEAKQYTFCSKVAWTPETDPVRLLTKILLAYQATFRQLGDLKPEEI